MRNVTFSGTIANFGAVTKERTSGDGERNDAFAVRFVNIGLDRKDEETGYTEQAAVKVVAGGYLAERLTTFAAGEKITFAGKLDKDKDYEKDGELVKGGLHFRIDLIDGWSEAEKEKFNNNGTTAKTSSSAPKAPAKTLSKKPAATGSKTKTVPKLTKK